MSTASAYTNIIKVTHSTSIYRSELPISTLGNSIIGLSRQFNALFSSLLKANPAKTGDAKSSVYRANAPRRQDCQIAPHKLYRGLE